MKTIEPNLGDLIALRRQAARRASDAATEMREGAATGGVRTTLRLESLAVLAGALIAYDRTGGGWGLFALLFLLPDLSMLGYLAGPRIGARVYNLAHSYLVPLGIAALGLLVALPFALPLALIWAAHVAFDRALGFGLKYDAGFGFTHLGRVGRQDPW
ncbi:DUF4260 domain-containing protein [Variovorax sp. UC122_21]|uniref:DUF4260 domain-containing protein n=1 Tax=Variovorax sp. UC122_21 TaxID=3374554 RepID=UPI003757E27B